MTRLSSSRKQTLADDAHIKDIPPTDTVVPKRHVTVAVQTEIVGDNGRVGFPSPADACYTEGI